MLFTSNTRVENKFLKGDLMQHEICHGVYAAGRTQVPVKTSMMQ